MLKENLALKTFYSINGLDISLADIDKHTELHLCPSRLNHMRVKHRKAISGRPENANYSAKPVVADSIVQISLAEDGGCGAFSAGITMKNGPTVAALELNSVEHHGEGTDDEELLIYLTHTKREIKTCFHIAKTSVPGTLRTWTEIFNEGKDPVTLQYITSFVLSGITPFAIDDAPGRLITHRFRSNWSNEGRHSRETLESLHLERDWAGYHLPSERFGQVGTLPVRKWFPFAAIEDTQSGVTWGAQLAWAGSWQMEISRHGDSVSLSGGLADYEFGHWRKTLSPGESFSTPVAHLACVEGGLEEIGNHLVWLQESLLPPLPENETDMPIVFNDWCTNWGSPSHEKTIELARGLSEIGVKYYVIDDGWAKRPEDATMQSNGDWIVDDEKFPNGLGYTCEMLRSMGLIPGIWFEAEVCNPGSQAFELSEYQLHKNGQPLQNGSRRFWDLNHKWVKKYIETKIIKLLKENYFGYLKIDYNDTIGIGCDDHNSYGEGLRKHVHGIYAMFNQIRKSLPDLVIENCSSGGHRLEPSMMNCTSMSSFSDAHESWNIPIIARQLHHLVPPRQLQIWAVIHPEDSEQRLSYTLCAAFYGRMCLSGDIANLSPFKTQKLKEAIKFYSLISSIIYEGRTYFIGKAPDNWYNPDGWLATWRVNRDEDIAVMLLHDFSQRNRPLCIRIPSGTNWKIDSYFFDGTTKIPYLAGDNVVFAAGDAFRGHAILFTRSQKRHDTSDGYAV